MLSIFNLLSICISVKIFASIFKTLNLWEPLKFWLNILWVITDGVRCETSYHLNVQVFELSQSSCIIIWLEKNKDFHFDFRVRILLTHSRCRKYEEAIQYHKKALVLQPKSASTFSAIGYNYMLMGDYNKAVEYFHKALSIRKNDSFTSEMLKIAVDELVNDLSTDIKGLLV